MPRPRLSDEERAKRKAIRNKDFYEKSVLKNEDGKDQNYTQYLEDVAHRKQLKLTLTLKEFEAIKIFCDENNTKPQDYIRQLIREDLGLSDVEDQ